jgi:hypothetical protein
VLTPLRAVLDAAVAAGLLERNPAASVVLPRRRSGRAFTLDTYGHLLDGDLGPALELGKELRPADR